MKIPHRIVRKSPKWYIDTHTGKYIHKDNLQAYIDELAQLKIKL